MTVAVPADRVLVVGPSWVGDMVMTQSLCLTLVQENPQVRIDMLAPAWCGALVARMPQVQKLIDLPFGHGAVQLSARRRLGRQLASAAYEQAILVPNSLKSALVPFFAGIPQRTGWRGEWRYGLLNDVRPLDESEYPSMLSRLVALALPKDAPLPLRMPWPRFATDVQAQQTVREKYALTTDRPVIALCPGAEYGPSKRWPEAHVAALATSLIERGCQVWLFGSAKDVPVVDSIRQGIPTSLQAQAVSLAGRTSLLEAVDLLAQATAVVSNDSGLMHVAAAVGVPVVALYGSSSPDYTPPLSPKARILSLNLDCSPCFQRDCPLGHRNCLNHLLPAQVGAALAQLDGLECLR